ncbi:MAG: MBL fold metallo-hydrolase [Candidatus Hodarchaeales archaeon]|jgi:glyoxylase-like metal-dependent hydrolase (beta-lactamase superfamily II)
MFIKRFVVGGPTITNCYIVACEETSEAMIVDPGLKSGEEQQILDVISEHEFQVKYVLNTHGHPDHFGGNGVLKKVTNAEILVHEKDNYILPTPWIVYKKLSEMERSCPKCGKVIKPILAVDEDQGMVTLACEYCGPFIQVSASPPADTMLHEGDIVNVGKLSFKVIHVPGHSHGSILLYCKEERVIFAGDMLAAGEIGAAPPPPFGSQEELVKSLRKMMELPCSTRVYPGHLQPTTIGEEKMNVMAKLEKMVKS